MVDRSYNTRRTANMMPPVGGNQQMPSCPSCEGNHGGNCGGNDGDKRAMQRRLKAIDFCIADTVLYLDAYPDSREALAYYHKLMGERTRLAERLAEGHSPLTSWDNTCTEHWDWISGPWPWEAAAN